MVPPVFPAAKVEHEGLALLFVLHEKSERGHVHLFMAFLDRLHEGPGGNDNICCGVYDVYIYTVVAFG